MCIYIYINIYIQIYIYIKTDSHSTKITVNRIMSNSTTRISRNGRSEQKHIVDSNPRCVSRFNDSKRRTTGERSVGLVPPTYQQIFCPCRWVSPKIFFRKYTANKELSKKVLQLKQGLQGQVDMEILSSTMQPRCIRQYYKINCNSTIQQSIIQYSLEKDNLTII